MSLFKRENNSETADNGYGPLAEIALAAIHDGVVITNRDGVIQFINPAAVIMTGCGSAENAVNLDYGLLIKIETKEGRELADSENPLIQAMKTGQPLERFVACLVVKSSGKRIPIAIAVAIASGEKNRIITFRDVTKELVEDSEQAEFVSTASHEMRTPVASIEGYLSLALNPQTATIDERARGYLNAAHDASQHLGKLFRDLLDATKLEDGHLRPHFEPVEMVGLTKQIADSYMVAAKNAKLNYQFGANKSRSVSEVRKLDQVVYGYVDVDFMREILANLIENAIKYTPAGGSIYINTLGDGDRVLVNVTDTGIGISSDDIHHIFQKFYRADNSDTRTIGGTGLGLYIVKQRVEAMGGRVWAESAFGEGSTFYVSLPRISGEEYEKRMIAFRNEQLLKQQTTQPAMPKQAAAPPVTIQPVISPTAVAPQQPTQNNVNNQNGGTK